MTHMKSGMKHWDGEAKQKSKWSGQNCAWSLARETGRQKASQSQAEPLLQVKVYTHTQRPLLSSNPGTQATG